MQFRVFMAGEVADSDVVAHRSLTVEDTEAAKIKRNQVAMLQPTVFDLSVTEIAALRQKIFGMLKLINGQETSPEAQDALRASLAEKLATPVSSDLLAQWMSPEVQEYVLSTGLPWFEDRLLRGRGGRRAPCPALQERDHRPRRGHKGGNPAPRRIGYP